MSLADDHVQAVLDLLDAADGLTVYDGKVPAGAAYPHAVAYPDNGLLDTDRLGGGSGPLVMLVQITAVGVERWSAQWAADTARTALVDVRPTVTGRACDQIRQVLSRPIERDDDDPARVVFYGVDQYRLRSLPS